MEIPIRAGQHAPHFQLGAANRFDGTGEPQQFALRQLIVQGPAIVEFLRGAW